MEDHSKTAVTQHDLRGWLGEKISAAENASRFMDENWSIIPMDKIEGYERTKAIEAQEAEKERMTRNMESRQIEDYAFKLQASNRDKLPLVVLVGDVQVPEPTGEAVKAYYAPLTANAGNQISPNFKTWLSPNGSGALVFKHGASNDLHLSKKLPGSPTSEDVSKALSAL